LRAAAGPPTPAATPPGMPAAATPLSSYEGMGGRGAGAARWVRAAGGNVGARNGVGRVRWAS
jgi:hypothetical protein